MSTMSKSVVMIDGVEVSVAASKVRLIRSNHADDLLKAFGAAFPSCGGLEAETFDFGEPQKTAAHLHDINHEENPGAEMRRPARRDRVLRTRRPPRRAHADRARDRRGGGLRRRDHLPVRRGRDHRSADRATLSDLSRAPRRCRAASRPGFALVTFLEIMLARAASFERTRPLLSAQGQAFVDRVLDPEHGFAITARRTYASFAEDGGDGSDAGYRAVYALVPAMWEEAGYYELPIRDIWELSKAEARAVPARVAFTHPSARHMTPVARKVLTRLLRTKIGLT